MEDGSSAAPAGGDSAFAAPEEAARREAGMRAFQRMIVDERAGLQARALAARHWRRLAALAARRARLRAAHAHVASRARRLLLEGSYRKLRVSSGLASERRRKRRRLEHIARLLETRCAAAVLKRYWQAWTKSGGFRKTGGPPSIPGAASRADRRLGRKVDHLSRAAALGLARRYFTAWKRTDAGGEIRAAQGGAHLKTAGEPAPQIEGPPGAVPKVNGNGAEAGSDLKTAGEPAPLVKSPPGAVVKSSGNGAEAESPRRRTQQDTAEAARKVDLERTANGTRPSSPSSSVSSLEALKKLSPRNPPEQGFRRFCPASSEPPGSAGGRPGAADWQSSSLSLSCDLTAPQGPPGAVLKSNGSSTEAGSDLETAGEPAPLVESSPGAVVKSNGNGVEAGSPRRRTRQDTALGRPGQLDDAKEASANAGIPPLQSSSGVADWQSSSLSLSCDLKTAGEPAPLLESPLGAVHKTNGNGAEVGSPARRRTRQDRAPGLRRPGRLSANEGSPLLQSSLGVADASPTTGSRSRSVSRGTRDNIASPAKKKPQTPTQRPNGLLGESGATSPQGRKKSAAGGGRGAASHRPSLRVDAGPGRGSGRLSTAGDAPKRPPRSPRLNGTSQQTQQGAAHGKEAKEAKDAAEGPPPFDDVAACFNPAPAMTPHDAACRIQALFRSMKSRRAAAVMRVKDDDFLRTIIVSRGAPGPKRANPGPKTAGTRQRKDSAPPSKARSPAGIPRSRSSEGRRESAGGLFAPSSPAPEQPAHTPYRVRRQSSVPVVPVGRAEPLGSPSHGGPKKRGFDPASVAGRYTMTGQAANSRPMWLCEATGMQIMCAHRKWVFKPAAPARRGALALQSKESAVGTWPFTVKTWLSDVGGDGFSVEVPLTLRTVAMRAADVLAAAGKGYLARKRVCGLARQKVDRETFRIACRNALLKRFNDCWQGALVERRAKRRIDERLARRQYLAALLRRNQRIVFRRVFAPWRKHAAASAQKRAIFRQAALLELRATIAVCRQYYRWHLLFAMASRARRLLLASSNALLRRYCDHLRVYAAKAVSHRLMKQHCVRLYQDRALELCARYFCVLSARRSIGLLQRDESSERARVGTECTWALLELKAVATRLMDEWKAYKRHLLFVTANQLGESNAMRTIAAAWRRLKAFTTLKAMCRRRRAKFLSRVDLLRRELKSKARPMSAPPPAQYKANRTMPAASTPKPSDGAPPQMLSWHLSDRSYPSTPKLSGCAPPQVLSWHLSDRLHPLKSVTIANRWRGTAEGSTRVFRKKVLRSRATMRPSDSYRCSWLTWVP
ncbi:hypothetical protein DIPPA_20490 [Diplonema papillatum]|nr:hypothetical protein DIPPA_20490 [Diplonema papillatum]